MFSGRSRPDPRQGETGGDHDHLDPDGPVIRSETGSEFVPTRPVRGGSVYPWLPPGAPLPDPPAGPDPRAPAPPQPEAGVSAPSAAPPVTPSGAPSAAPPAEAGAAESPAGPQEEPAAASVRPAFPAPRSYGDPHPRAGKPRGFPPDRDAVPDTVIDGADFHGLTVRGASLRGDDHRYQRELRQDSMGLWTLTDRHGKEVLLACVADGVGSQPLSHHGSQQACLLLREEAEQRLEELLGAGGLMGEGRTAERLVERVAFRMRAAAEDQGVDPKALSTTLVAAVVELTPPDRPRNCFVFRLGDSTALLLRNGAFQELWADAHGDGAVSDSGTEALPGHIRPVDTEMIRLGGDDALVICTDGLVNPMRNQDVRADLARCWSTGPVPGLLEFACQLGFRAKSFGDDRTAVCIWGR